uniref:Uncharacterized protein n=1 Tax=Anguilla anguilla TaxID=7936 RepID=A0A0E9U4G9_ANGAN
MPSPPSDKMPTWTSLRSLWSVARVPERARCWRTSWGSKCFGTYSNLFIEALLQVRPHC